MSVTILVGLGIKFDRMLANQDYIPILEYGFIGTMIVSISTVKTVSVLKDVVVAIPINLGMVSRNGRVIDLYEVVWLTANRYDASRQYNLAYDLLVKLEIQL